MYNLDDSSRNGPRLFVFDNVDPHQFGSFLEWVGDKLTKLFSTSSASPACTAETAAQMLVIFELIEKNSAPMA